MCREGWGREETSVGGPSRYLCDITKGHFSNSGARQGANFLFFFLQRHIWNTDFGELNSAFQKCFILYSHFFCFCQGRTNITPDSLNFSRSLRLCYLYVPSAAQGISGICAFRPLFHLSHHTVPRPALSRIDRGSRLPSSLPSG